MSDNNQLLKILVHQEISKKLLNTKNPFSDSPMESLGYIKMLGDIAENYIEALSEEKIITVPVELDEYEIRELVKEVQSDIQEKLINN